MRLDKFISNFSDYSRSEVKKLIKAQRVTLNAQIATQADATISCHEDLIEVDGIKIEALDNVYLMLHKPKGVVCANTDSEHPTVIDILRSSSAKKNPSKITLPFNDLQIAGRLDIDTTGLVFITTDGKWNQRVTSPSQHAKKTYKVSLAEDLADEVIEKFRHGILLNNENKKTRPATLEKITPREVLLSLSEGKYHQVKRMFAAVGNHVIALHRVSIAGITLDPELEPGDFRHIAPQELDTIQRHLGSPNTEPNNHAR